ncbi:MAG TPA: hypothetical protein VGH20_10490 [Myxococcales bacterium]|jgi:hypothetical protein
MRRAVVLLGLCAACGGIEPTNNGLEGRWTSSSDVASSIVMVLVPGPKNVSGQVSVTFAVDGHVANYAVSTLPDERIEWTLTSGGQAGDPTLNDFHVHIVPYCPGEVHPPPSRVYLIDLDGLVFKRDTEAPFCPDFNP